MNSFEIEQRKQFKFLKGVYMNLIDAANQRGNLDAAKRLNERLGEISVQHRMLLIDRCEASRAAKRKAPDKPEELDRLPGWANKELRDHFRERLEVMRRKLGK